MAAPAGAPEEIGAVIARMESVDAALPATDGVACFNRMYLAVTRSVNDQVQQGVFGDPVFLARLDEVFAGLYFEAIDAMDGPLSDVPVAWRPLVQNRAVAGIEPVQFALAGMNAHINHDLPLAVVATCAQLGTEPTAGTHHQDYQRVNALLDSAEQSVRESFEPAQVVTVDHHLAAVTNVIANWSINSAREVAWDTALALWEVRDHPVATGLLTGSLGRAVAMASRGLLAVV